jgi:hypothetical protein
MVMVAAEMQVMSVAVLGMSWEVKAMQSWER